MKENKCKNNTTQDSNLNNPATPKFIELSDNDLQYCQGGITVTNSGMSVKMSKTDYDSFSSKLELEEWVKTNISPSAEIDFDSIKFFDSIENPGEKIVALFITNVSFSDSAQSL